MTSNQLLREAKLLTEKALDKIKEAERKIAERKIKDDEYEKGDKLNLKWMGKDVKMKVGGHGRESGCGDNKVRWVDGTTWVTIRGVHQGYSDAWFSVYSDGFKPFLVKADQLILD